MKEVNKTRTFTCDSCKEEIEGYVSYGDHRCVEVEAIHTIWGSVQSFRIHFCDDCVPVEPLSDEWDTVESVTYNAGLPEDTPPQVTVVKVKWTAGYMGGDAKIERPQKFDGTVREYIQIIERVCKDREYEYGPEEYSF